MRDVVYKTLLIICYIIVIVITIFASLLSSVLFKREQYNKNPYYWCDATWECCKNGNSCDAGKSVDEIKSTGLDTYYPSDLVAEGSPYHQNCILPVKNAFNNYPSSTESSFDLAFLYEGNAPTTSLIWGKGCTGPGGQGKCSDPTYNPQVNPYCNYHSFDAPTADWAADFLGATGSLPGANGNFNFNNSTSLNRQNWQQKPSSSILDPNFQNFQGTNLAYMQYSWDPATSTSNSGFTCGMTNSKANQQTPTTCFNNYNVLRPEKFSSPTTCTNPTN